MTIFRIRKIFLSSRNSIDESSSAQAFSVERTYPAALDISFYRNYYKDLSHLKEDRELIDHYMHYGRQEGRFQNAVQLSETRARLPSDFIPSKYRELNLETKSLSDEDTCIHYCTIGKFAGLAYKDNQIQGFDHLQLRGAMA